MNRKNIFIILFLFMFCLSVNASFTSLFSDNFNDGTITDWDVNSGTWSAGNLDLNGAFLDGGSISHSITMPAGAQYQIHYTARATTAGLNGEFNFFTDQNGITNMNGYRMVLQNATTVLQKVVNGTPSTLISGGGVSLANNHSVDINIVGTTITVFVDGSSIGSVIDSTYTHGSKIFFNTQGGASAWAFDDLNVASNASATNYGTITFLRPIDEKTLTSIDGNWSVQLLNGTGSAFLSGNDSQKNFIVEKSDTVSSNFIVDDSNSGTDVYFPRSYYLTMRMNDANTLVVQPYLVKQSEGTIVSFIVYNKFDNTTISNLRASITRSINLTTGVQVEKSITNATGVVGFAFLNLQPYDLNLTSLDGNTVYFPLGSQNGTYINYFTTYNVFVINSSNDTNNTSRDYNFSFSPSGDSLDPSTTQYFDANIETNYANYITIEFWDGNTLITSSTGIGNDYNFATVFNTQNVTSGFITTRVVMGGPFKTNVIYNSYRIVVDKSSLGNSLTGLTQRAGVWAGVILTLIIIFAVLQVFGPSLYGNNESQLFVTGIVLIGAGVLFFSNNFFVIVIALTFGVVVYLQTRT